MNKVKVEMIPSKCWSDISDDRAQMTVGGVSVNLTINELDWVIGQVRAVKNLVDSEASRLGTDLNPISGDVGVLIPIEDWVEMVNNGNFIDYDGHGNWATATHHGNEMVEPSDITGFHVEPPRWATHVLWYNR